MTARTRVAFICTHNACRSQIAEALARLRASDIIEPYSAGTDPVDAPNPDALRLLAARGVDTAGLRSKALGEIPAVDIVVTMGCDVSCPTLPCKHRDDWGLDDPTGKGDAAMEACMLAIQERVDDLAQRLRAGELAPQTPSVAVLRALADETRLEIVSALSREGELCACKLLEHLAVSQSTLSHHMKILVEAGLVFQRKEGRWSHYRLDPERFACLGRAISALAAPSLDEGETLRRE